MDLNQKKEIVNWPLTHYVYIEKIGPFQETAQQCWQELHKLIPEISSQHKITGYMALYKVNPSKMVYRAGVSLAAKPTALPKGLQQTEFQGGKYARFVLNGSYSQLPEACGIVFKTVEETKLPRRDDFCIEHYVTDPRTTAEKDLITEILIPTL